MATASPGVWHPPPDSRWQYQLESNDTSLASTGGIDTGICVVPFTGDPCVHPNVFDIDLYVDPNVAGNNHTVDTAADVRSASRNSASVASGCAVTNARR